ncbi:HdeD family acid-resistance protein [Latilactobacillus graminis]|nr:DUF308 domain-containing protein [Latilactobacillus graminis]QFP79939.1 hypothetical protein LG542_06620 [Latilactobacillus graminis]
MFRKNEWHFDWSELMTGVIFLIVAYCLFKQPGKTLSGLVIVIAIAAIIRGISKISAYSRLRQETGMRATLMLVDAIVDVILGILFILNVPAGVAALGYIFAFWFLFDSIIALLNVSHLKQFNTGLYILSMILNILGVIVGLLLLMAPVVAAVTIATLVGFYFAFFGINAIIIAFARRL